ncbi:HAD family hydrolase [Nocardioides alcanivorans]|uniref:HAD family hydrolase n=1 Tax=Nocardioides alcanivorans TaxID=2897352 RepID=UPI001F3AEDD5|nr:HAD family hydrolase [Nocardioides alcanivorans]
MFKLVATDLDGTFLRDDLSVSPRTRAAVDAVRALGIPVVPVTARQPVGLRDLAEEAGFRSWAVCSNGGLVIDLATGTRLHEAEVSVAAQTALVEALAEALPGSLYVSVRDGGEVFVPVHGYGDIADLRDHKRAPETMGGHPIATVLAEPSLKFIVRHPQVSVPEVLDVVRGLGLTGFGVTHSGAPFVEVMPEGVSKATGLERLCAELGIGRDEVLAFGDAPNDVEMVAWAGHGVAVANAAPEVRAVAAEVTASNAEDGVALVLEKLVAGGGVLRRE